MKRAFALLPFRFHFQAVEPIAFPPLTGANVLRGAFGIVLRSALCVPECQDPRLCPRTSTCAYARIFEPSGPPSRPSGFANPPRPYLLRAQSLDGIRCKPGDTWSFDLHLFDIRPPSQTADLFRGIQAMAELGIGAGRGRSRLIRAELLDASGEPAKVVEDARDLTPLILNLEPPPGLVGRVLVQFVTPTELKQAGSLAGTPEFNVLFARVRDRISSLASLYGEGPLQFDFAGIGERAADVRIVRADLSRVQAARRSSRTGRVHPLGGFIGTVEYEGGLSEFLPWLRAAWWTGVGRQTVWGKGAIRTVVLG